LADKTNTQTVDELWIEFKT